jgi:hemolysin activation/secretion protein
MFCFLTFFLTHLISQPCIAQESTTEPVAQRKLATPTLDRDGYAYPVSKIVFTYPFEHPDLPNLELLNEITVLLSPTNNGWVSPTENASIVPIRIREIQTSIDQPESIMLYGSALAAINQSVRDYMESEYGLIGHLVTPNASEIEYRTTRADIREQGNHQLTIMIWRAVIGEVRTVAHGDRLAEKVNPDEPESNVNHKEHKRVRDRIDTQEGALLTREEIDDQVHRLNRHPGRRVDAAIAPTSEPGEVIVDYLITEPKNWNAYIQTSNTGTKSTDEWQQRFGYINRQLTRQDDVFTLDYVTTAFDESNAVLSSYSFDLGQHARAKIYGRWNEYTATDVGLGFENFLGEGFSIGAEAAINVWQSGPKFVDVVAGARVEHIHVENRLFLIEGDEDFLLPYLGVRFEKSTPLHSARGELIFESNWGSVVGSSKAEVQRLGRFGADDDFSILRGQLSHSFYLEPIFDPEGFRGDRGTDSMTLAHEIALNFRGQYSFESRLVPNYEFVAGGFYSVRGYPESAAVGDDALLGSIEYRYHLGRSMPASDKTTSLFGNTFRTARARPYGRADWDVILKGFVDIAQLGVNDAPFFEQSETLVGAGVGIETQLKSNITLKLDYGMAFTNIGQGASQTTQVGDTRLHFSAQFVF